MTDKTLTFLFIGDIILQIMRTRSEKMAIQLSDHFNYKRLLRFTLPSVIMMVFTSIYGVVDGFFVSNFAGKTPFTAVNFIWPLVMVLGAVGFMFGTGGSALVSKTMGEGNLPKANRIFSLLVYSSIASGLLLGLLGFVIVRPVAVALGAEGEMLEQCVLYGRILLAALPTFVLQMEFQSFFVTAEKPTLGLIFTLVSGATNMLLDFLFIAVFRWGIAGAALATAISQTIGGVFPLFYFFAKNHSPLRLTRAGFDGKALLQACTNGSSELLSNVSMSLVGMLYNAQLMRYAGEDGVAAYGVLMYVTFAFSSTFIGYAVGTAPIIGYHHGANNHTELKSLLKKSVILITAASLSMFLLAEALALPLSYIFVGYDENLLQLTKECFFIYSFSFLFAGMAIYGSSFFTALNNGLVSAVISFLRTLVFQVAAVIIFPLIWGVSGIWLSVVAAEFMAVAVTVIFLFALKKKHQY